MRLIAVRIFWMCVAVFVFGYPTASNAQVRARKYSNDFLQIGVGARAAGMGNAQVANVSDVTAGYWNPAGLANTERRHELGLMHSEYFAGIAKYDYLGYTTRIDDTRRLAVSAIRLGIDDIPNTLQFREGNSFNFDRITSFSVADLAVLVSYAQRIKAVDGLSVGGNVKVINRVIGDFATAWGFGLDAGVQYRRGGLGLGLTVADLTNTFNAWTFNTELFEDVFRETGNEIPQNSIEITRPSVRLGVSYKFLREKKVNVALVTEALITTDGRRNNIANLGSWGSLDQRAGVEVSLWNYAFLRGGVMNFQYITDIDNHRRLDVFPTAGVGLAYKIFALDYALTNIGSFQDNMYSHLVSLRISFNQIRL